MWFFRSPVVCFGEDALGYLAQLRGKKAFIVTDSNLLELGLVEPVQEQLAQAGMESVIFAEVEPDPSLQTVKRGAQEMLVFEPDWVVGLGGGSAMDAAKGMWILYERPDLEPRDINPFDDLGLRRKARMVAIPTTSGTGAEATWGIVMTDVEEQRKIGTGSPEAMPDVAIVDPALAAGMPPGLTALTGMDALTHAVEGYTSTWHSDFCDGLCLKAVQMVFDYLPRAHAHGSGDVKAREKMHNAATIAGLGIINSMAALAHAMGHSLGAVFHTPHGRAVGLFLPYTIEFSVRGMVETRYADVARFLGLPASDEREAAANLAAAIRDLAARIGEPRSLAEVGISGDDFETHLAKLVENAENDTQVVAAPRQPTVVEMERLFRYAYEGSEIDF